MFLKSLEINGFKSFADKTKIVFSDGITSLLGPNGCGKSNIVDSIKWVLGEQSTKSVRAQNMQDIIFNGSDLRKPLSMAEVTLTIDNEEHNLPTEIPEIVIKRRIYRGGESEYYLNGQRCKLKNIKDLFLDTGVGKTAYSILEQGKIDQILSNKPEDRRYIFEEAAGISRYKQTTIEAQNRINKSNENIEKLMITVNETKRTYDRTLNQAKKALEWEKLRDEALNLEVEMRLGKIEVLTLIKESRIKQINDLSEKLKINKETLDKYYSNISSSSDEVEEYRNRINSLDILIASKQTECDSLDNTINALEDSFRDYLLTLQSSEARLKKIDEDVKRYREQEEEIEVYFNDLLDDKDEKNEQILYINKEIEKTQIIIEETKNTLYQNEIEITNCNEEISKLSSELKNVIENLIFEFDKKLGPEYSELRRNEADSNLVLSINRVKTAVKGVLDIIVKSEIFPPKELITPTLNKAIIELENSLSLFSLYKESIPDIVDIMLSPEGLLSKKREIEKKENTLREKINYSNSIITDSRSILNKKEEEFNSLKLSLTSISTSLESLETLILKQEERRKEIQYQVTSSQFNLEDEKTNLNNAKSRISEIQERIRELEEKQQDLKNEVWQYSKEREKINDDLNKCYQSLNEKRLEKERLETLISSSQAELHTLEFHNEQTESSIEQEFKTFFEKNNRSLNEFIPDFPPSSFRDELTLRTLLDETNKKMESLGHINYLAKDEFDQAEDQYKFFQKQLADLEKAKEGLVNVLDEITKKSRELFLTSYNQISTNFQLMFKRLFGGGRAELKLVDPDNVLESGIDILAQPPGKGMAKLNLLSGGERSMTAVALLFATYQVKPSPFCVLDEIDAALDDRNIGFFLDVLKDFSKDSQFIIITHNIHTVTGGDSMLGVSQIEAGVSTAVSYKIASLKGKPVILNENEEEMNFDEEGRLK